MGAVRDPAMSKERYVRVVLSCQGKDYVFDDPFPMGDAADEEVANTALWMYTEGNYCCDCNRANFIAEHCDDAPDFPEDKDGYVDMPCGHTIGLVSLVFVGSDGAERQLYPEPEDSPWRIRERLAAIGMIGL